MAINNNPKTICFRMIYFFIKKTKQRVTGLEPVQTELKSAMLHQLHHTRTKYYHSYDI